MPWFLGNFCIARQTPPANLLGTPWRKDIVFVLTNSVMLGQMISSTFFFFLFFFSPPVYADPFCDFLYA